MNTFIIYFFLILPPPSRYYKYHDHGRSPNNVEGRIRGTPVWDVNRENISPIIAPRIPINVWRARGGDYP